MDNDKTLKEHVESKVFKDMYMIISNLTKEEFVFIDKYCKKHYNNNRKQMLLSLIKYKEGELISRMLDDKITLIYNDLDNRVSHVEAILQKSAEQDPVKEEKKKKPVWGGFSDK